MRMGGDGGDGGERVPVDEGGLGVVKGELLEHESVEIINFGVETGG